MSTYIGMNAGEMVLQVRSMVGETQEGFFTNLDIKRWLNLGQLDFCQKTRLLTTSSTSESVAGQKKYGLKDDVMFILKVFYDGDKLSPKDLHQILAIVDRGSIDTEGTPRNYYLMGTTDSGLCLFLYPVPQDAGDDIEMWYMQRPDELEEDSDTSLIRPEFHMALCHYACRFARMKRREVTEARDEFAAYMDYVDQANEWRQQMQLDEPIYQKEHEVWDYVGVGDDMVTEDGAVP